MTKKRILSVGQCGADHTGILWTVKANFEAEVLPADTAVEALTILRDGGIDLILVNRVLDADGDSGLDLIRQVKSDKDLQQIPILLVSNYDHYQIEAIEAGALPGFGKAALGQPQMLDRLRNALASGGCQPPE